MRTISRLLVVLACTALAACAAPRLGRPPNIVLIVADDLGWRDLGCYGQEYARTPRLDALAAQGTRFTRAYAAGPVCSPTRAAIMSGQYPARVNINDWIPGPSFPNARMRAPADRDELALECVTLAEALRSVGYGTLHVGKWHLGGEGFLPQQQGFDVNLMGSHIGHPASHFFPYGHAADGTPASSHAVPDTFDEGASGEYLADRQAREASRLIERSAANGKPFLLALNFYAVHAPLEAKVEAVEKYREAKRRAGMTGTFPRPVYCAMVEHLDTAVGEVLDTLERLRISQDTVVIFTSDNGGLSTSTDNSPLRGGKRSLWEGGLRVPLIIRWPGRTPPGATSDEPVISQDIFATVCGAAGAAVPDAAREDARDLAPVLAGRARLSRDRLYWHFPQNETDTVGPRGALRTDRWKLIEELDGSAPLLFDLDADPSESRDVAADHPAVVDELLAELRAWRGRVGAAMPTAR